MQFTIVTFQNMSKQIFAIIHLGFHSFHCKYPNIFEHDFVYGKIFHACFDKFGKQYYSVNMFHSSTLLFTFDIFLGQLLSNLTQKKLSNRKKLLLHLVQISLVNLAIGWLTALLWKTFFGIVELDLVWDVETLLQYVALSFCHWIHFLNLGRPNVHLWFESVK